MSMGIFNLMENEHGQNEHGQNEHEHGKTLSQLERITRIL